MAEKSFIIKIIADILFFVLYLPAQAGSLFFVSSVQAITVSRLETIPAQPAYGQKFECILSVDSDDSNLACDMLGLADPDSKKPWDICPKISGLGYQYTSDGKRHYYCVADSSTNIPRPGNYRIVAWKFYGDGETGDVIYSKNITVLDHLPPTSIPTSTIAPSRKPTKIPRVNPTNTVIPSIIPTGANLPTQIFTNSPTQFNNQPTVYFPQNRQSLLSPLPSDSKRPLFTSFPNFSEIYNLAGVSSKIKYVPTFLKEKSDIIGKNIMDYYRMIFDNFLKESSF